MPHYVEPLFRPPSEARSLIFQITIGCSQNHCNFCGMYKGKKFRLKPVGEVRDEIVSLPSQYRSQVDRVFLADGDALVYPFDGLMAILDDLAAFFPRLARVGSYASPNSLTTKSAAELALLRGKGLSILYFGLESGDDLTLKSISKGFDAATMAELALKARGAGIKLSVTAILGLAGSRRSLDHALATAAWVNLVNPEYFSLLTLFHRHNDDFIRTLQQCSRRELMLEAREIVYNLNPTRTILRSNHVSNFLNLAGSYPKDRERIIAAVDGAMERAARVPGFLDGVPENGEEYY
ncbi:radical SAM protein [Geobacter sp. AOG1]|uniref:radical SAM protein n=1 Tax=Geobacter sp. AOG1 TaxID=1566346 RepID=UPI001CC56B69|nr:radical SAM protein [Geobacter sp. AOG1]GFE56877.1 radical SAM protein [Geobacter sp. AOG1]